MIKTCYKIDLSRYGLDEDAYGASLYEGSSGTIQVAITTDPTR
jgi:hypothetical protein